MFKMSSLEKADPRTHNCVVLTGNMNCSTFYAFEKERFIAFEARALQQDKCPKQISGLNSLCELFDA
jgi:hypothetical protein